jgi:hypothetical protein
MNKIIYTRPDGGLSIIHPIRNTYPKLEALTDEEVLERAKKDIPKGAINVQIIDESEIPKDRYFRNAWKAGQGTIEHDMLKCRELHREKMRLARKPLLETLDVEFMKALESGGPSLVEDIKSKKQKLRDITTHPDIEAAQTPEALKAVWPEELGERPQ